MSVRLIAVTKRCNKYQHGWISRIKYRWIIGNRRLSVMSTRSKATQGSNQTREVLKSPAFTRGEHLKKKVVKSYKEKIKESC